MNLLLQRDDRSPRTRNLAVLLLCVVCLVTGSIGFGRKIVQERPHDGISWKEDSGALPVAGVVEKDGPGWLAGIRSGDLLAAVEGKPIGGMVDLQEILWEIEAGSPAVYSVIRAGESREFSVPVLSVPATPSIYSYLALVGLFFLLAGMVVFLRLPSEPAALVFLFMGLGQYLVLVYSPTGRADWFDWLLYWGDLIGRLFTPALVFHFALTFPGGTALRRRRLYPIYLPATLLFLVNLILVGFGFVLRFSDPLAVMRIKDRVELLLVAAFLLAACGRFLFSYLKASDSQSRDQLRWVGSGSALALLPFILMYLVPRGLGFPVAGLWELSAIPMVLLPLFLAAAITSYRVVELEFFLKKGIRFLSFSFFVIAVFLAASIALTALFGPFLVAPERAGTLMAAVTAVLLVAPVRHLSNSLVDHMFYSSKYDLRRKLQGFTRELSSIHDLADLVGAFTDRVRKSLEVEELLVLVRLETGFRFQPVRSRDRSTEMDWDGSAWQAELLRDDFLEGNFPRFGKNFTLLVPMRVRGKVTALLALRGKGERGPVPREDRELLVSLCGQMAGSLESARLHGELADRIQEIDRLRQYSDGILESSQIGIMVVGPEGKIRAWNEAMTRIYGLERAQGVGRPAAEVLPLDLLRRLGLFETALNQDREQRLSRYPLTGIDGTRMLVNVTASRLAPRAGGTGGTVLTFDDVTAQARMHEELARRERLAAVGLLAAGVAHEVNTPLTGIASYTQMLLSGGSNRHEERRMLRQIEAQAFRASEIANRLLDLARSGGDLHEVVAINPLIGETLTLFGPQVRSRCVEVERNLAENLPGVVGNRSRLQQVFLNLLWNSVEAMPEGGRIQVTSRLCAGEILVEVKDSGVGIAPENLSRLYDPFFSTKRERGGTGLGLSVSYGIVQEHGGRLEVESREGTGTDFKVFLPARQAEVLQAG